MKAVRLLNILLLLSFLLTSCVPSTEEDAEIKEGLDDSFVVSEGAQTEPPAPSCYKDVYEVPRESITRKLDILIIPDTSSSIKEERRKIAEGFDYFIGALPQGVDFNIGVILGHSKNSNKSGKLYKKNSSDPLVLKSNELSLPKIKESLSLKIHKPKTDGYSDGGEMGMASLLNALEGVNLQNLKDNGLLRDDAALAVIFVADEQDICAKAPEGITFKKDPQNGERKSFVKYCIDEEISWKEVTIGGDYTYKITPKILLNKLKEIKGDMPLVVGGVLYDELSTIPTVGDIGGIINKTCQATTSILLTCSDFISEVE